MTSSTPESVPLAAFVAAARGTAPADLVLKNARMVKGALHRKGMSSRRCRSAFGSAPTRAQSASADRSWRSCSAAAADARWRVWCRRCGRRTGRSVGCARSSFGRTCRRKRRRWRLGVAPWRPGQGRLRREEAGRSVRGQDSHCAPTSSIISPCPASLQSSRERALAKNWTSTRDEGPRDMLSRAPLPRARGGSVELLQAVHDRPRESAGFINRVKSTGRCATGFLPTTGRRHAFRSGGQS